MTGRSSDEHGYFFGVPHSRDYGAAASTPRGVDSECDVAIDEIASYREIERVAHDEVRLMHRLRCEWSSVLAAAREQVVVEVVEVIGAEGTERDRTEAGEYVAVDDPRVSAGSRCPHLTAFAWEPHVGQEPAERR